MKHRFAGIGWVRSRWLCAGWLMAGLGSVAMGCTVTTDSNTTTSNNGQGSLTLNFTIASSNSPTQCSAYGAQTLQVQIYNATTGATSTTTVPCTAMTTTIAGLAAGTYSVTAQLMNAYNQPVTTTTPAFSVTIAANMNSTQAIDFPASSFTSATGSQGILEVDWTVESSVSVTECSAFGAQNISIQLYDTANNAYGAAHLASCSAFTTDIPNLPAGTYEVSAQMLDASNRPVSTATALVPVVVSAGATAVQQLDFPANSFTGSTGTYGAIEVDWTVASTSNPTQCSSHYASDLVVDVYDAYGDPYGSPQVAPCSSFSMVISGLPAGTYSVDGYMVDSSDQPVSTTIPPVTVVVAAGTTTTQRFDFPSNSFTY